MCDEQKAVLYARYSPRPKTRHGRVIECESIQTQLERLRAWALSLGIEILAEYTDEEMSGKEADNRPGLQAALQHACAARCILGVYSLSRLARNTRDALEISETLRIAKADLASLHERLDTSTPMGRFVFGLTAGLAQLEREQISDRTSDAMLRHQTSGRRMTHRDKVPFGEMVCDTDPSRTVVDPDEQLAIQEIVALRQKGLGPRKIARALDAAGYTRRGKLWANGHSVIQNILKREGV